MDKKRLSAQYADLAAALQIDCAQCSGLCCVALYCRKGDGFPEDKAAGTPCKHLMADFRCAIHPKLAASGMRGCLAYDCFGAGQRVTGLYAPHRSWSADPRNAEEVFRVFHTVFQLHQMLWYLLDGLSAVSDPALAAELEALLSESAQMAAGQPDALLHLELEGHRERVNGVLRRVIAHITPRVPKGGGHKDFLGRDWKRANLDGCDFSMALMIAANLEGCSLRGANFLGADLRDANIRNTDLSRCVFLTQMQLNSAKGNDRTAIPAGLSRPEGW